MEQLFAKEISAIDIAKILRKWKWFLLVAGVIFLAGALAFVWFNTKSNLELGYMVPKKISFSFNEKDTFAISTANLNKNEYERISLFLLNRDLLQKYANEGHADHGTHAGEPFDLTELIVPKFAVDFSNTKISNDLLQYLLFKNETDSALHVDVLGNFTLAIFRNYYLLEFFQEYYNYLHEVHFKSLNSQQLFLENMQKISMKIVSLHEQKKKNPGILSGRGNLMLQLNSESERYLDLSQQLTANEVLFSDAKIALELNQKKIAKTRFLLGCVDDLQQDFQKAFFRNPNQAKGKLLAMQKGFVERELTQEFQKLEACFDLITYNFNFYHGNPMMLQSKFPLLKGLALFIFACGLLLLAILVLEFRKK